MKFFNMDNIEPLIIQKYVRMATDKNFISFAAGLPDMSVLPLRQVKEAFAAMEDSDTFSFQYQPPLEKLKIQIQTLMATLSLSCNLDEILIINGAQQGIFLSSQLFFQKNASLMVQEFVYPGFLQVTNLFQLNYLPLHSSPGSGIDFCHMESILKTQAVLPYFYLVSNGHNPLGITLDTEARKNLAYLADKYQFIIIEDDPYGFLNLTEKQYLPMRAYTNNAIYIGSFSKIIAPALRTGWMVGDPDVIEKLQQLKDMNDLCNLNPNHFVINHLLENHALSEIIQLQTRAYQKKLMCMTSTLDRYLQLPHAYKKPLHGMFLWLEFPDADLNSQHARYFEESKVLYVPAPAFSTDKSCQKSAIRLNFTFPSCEEIETGIQRLSKNLNQRFSALKKAAVICC